MLTVALRKAESAAEWMWKTLWEYPLIGALLWVGIGFEFWGLSSVLTGLAPPLASFLTSLRGRLGWAVPAVLGLLFLAVRLASGHLHLNHVRLDRRTGTISCPPLFSSFHPATGRAILLSALIAFLDASLLRVTTEALAALHRQTDTEVGVDMVAGPPMVIAGLIAFAVQTGLVFAVLWLVNGRLIPLLRQRMPASWILLQTRDPSNRFRFAVSVEGLIYLPIVLGLLWSYRTTPGAMTVLLVLLLVKAGAAIIYETGSFVMDWWNSCWMQGLGRQLARTKDLAQRLTAVERMARLADVAGPVWPELPAALTDTAQMGALSGQLLKQSVEFTFYLTEKDWNGALGVGDAILQWFPDSGMAKVVQEKMSDLRSRAGSR
jgi:hypothetical protein